MRAMIIAAAVLGVVGTSTAAMAEIYGVEMLNRGPDGGNMVYSPGFLQIQPGDTVKFVASDRGHNVVSIEGAIPEGAEPFKGGINEEIEVSFEVPGVYAYKCTPHYGMGMVGVIVVGEDTSNLDEVAEQRYPGRSKQTIVELLDEVRSSIQ